MEPKIALRNLHLISKDGRMTHAGVWLLARDIRRFNIRADVACVLFMGTDIKVSEPWVTTTFERPGGTGWELGKHEVETRVIAS